MSHLFWYDLEDSDDNTDRSSYTWFEKKITWDMESDLFKSTPHNQKQMDELVALHSIKLNRYQLLHTIVSHENPRYSGYFMHFLQFNPATNSSQISSMWKLLVMLLQDFEHKTGFSTNKVCI